jgi:hypothetical protein
MIKFKIGGRTVDPRNLEDAMMAMMLESVRKQITEKVGGIRDPDTGEFPTIVVHGDSIDKLSCQVEGSPKLVALVKERLPPGDLGWGGSHLHAEPGAWQPRGVFRIGVGDCELIGGARTLGWTVGCRARAGNSVQNTTKDMTGLRPTHGEMFRTPRVNFR